MTPLRSFLALALPTQLTLITCALICAACAVAVAAVTVARWLA